MTHGGSTPATYGTVMLTALIRLHDALQQVRLPLDVCPAWTRTARPSGRWSTSSRTT